MNNKPRRALTSARTLATLSNALVIAGTGPNKLTIDGLGNDYVREGDGTHVTIFNVNAFANADAAKAAAAHWAKGLKFEKAGDAEKASAEFVEALNQRMSFSVLAENSADFKGAFQINCMIEDIQNAKGETVRVINRPRPLAVEAAGGSAASFFESAAAEEKPTTGASTGAKTTRRRATA